MGKLKLNIFVPLLLFFTIVIVYDRLPYSFFQQDEWRAFGVFAVLTQDFLLGVKYLLPKNILEHISPLSVIFEFIQFKLFGVSFLGFSLVSMILKFLNSLLVYVLYQKLTRNKTIALIGSILFAVNSFSHQAVSWISSSTSTQGSAFFAILSIIFFLDYLRKNQVGNLNLFFSLFMFFLSINLKESSIFLFVFFPILWFIYAREKKALNLKRIILPLFILFLIYIFFRSSFLIYGFKDKPNTIKGTTMQNVTVITYIYRLITSPFKSISQSIFSTSFLLDLSKKLVIIAYPHWLVASDGVPNPYVVESIAFDFIGYIATLLMLITFFCMYKYLLKLKDKTAILSLIFALTFIVISYTPFVFIPGIAGFISIAEPRNLYFPSIGSSLFLAIFIIVSANYLSKRIGNRFYLVFMLIPLSFLIFVHTNKIKKDLAKLEHLSAVRKNILNIILTKYPRLRHKVVFYIKSDKAYYGLSENDKILPFQSGFGRTLLIWYYGFGEHIPSCMLIDDWLYQLSNDQGYKYCNGRGFGYFRKLEDLEDALIKNNLSIANILAFEWNSKNESFKETTLLVRKNLQKLHFR